MKYKSYSDYFGDSPRVKLLDIFVEYKFESFYVVELAKKAKINRLTVIPILKKLLKQKIIQKTKKVGRSEMYQIREIY